MVKRTCLSNFKNQKTMKTTFLKISAFVLFFALMGAGCEKENKIDYDPASIVGKWKQIKTASCVGYNNSMIEFTKDSVFKGYIDNILAYTSKINIKKGSNYSDTIFFEEKGNYTYMYLTKTGNDTLTLDPPFVSITASCTTYKRLK